MNRLFYHFRWTFMEHNQKSQRNDLASDMLPISWFIDSLWQLIFFPFFATLDASHRLSLYFFIRFHISYEFVSEYSIDFQSFCVFLSSFIRWFCFEQWHFGPHLTFHYSRNGCTHQTKGCWKKQREHFVCSQLLCQFQPFMKLDLFCCIMSLLCGNRFWRIAAINNLQKVFEN